MNLKSLFPSSNNSQFDIYVSNIYYPQFNFYNQRFSLNSSEYDYKILGNFDGQDTITVQILRNEIDTSKRKIFLESDEGTTHTASLSEFWKRDALKIDGFRKKDFTQQYKKALSAQETLRIDPNKLQEIGPFSAELYFIKNTPSTIDIIKPINASTRKDILKSYSGIKLFRDGFKVRPYGEQGNGYDWLGLSIRAQKSPAAVSHESGSWKVRLNQLIGEVRISQGANPNLEDMANREGLVQNETYSNFIRIILKMIEVFEADRQYICREFAHWKKLKEDSISKVPSVVQQAKTELNSDKEMQDDSAEKKESIETQHYTVEDYKYALVKIEQKRQEQERTNKILMLYSSSGVMTSTFSHEIEGIRTKVGSRMQHLRAVVQRAIGEYNGIDAFNKNNRRNR